MAAKMQEHNIHGITHRDMVSRLIKEPEKLHDHITRPFLMLLHAVLGMEGELGELTEESVNPFCDQGNVILEMGDYEFYLEYLYQVYDKYRAFREPDTVIRQRTVILKDLKIDTAKITDLVKKQFVRGNPVAWDTIMPLIAGIEKHLANLKRSHGILYPEVTTMRNIEKLATRFPDFGYTDQLANEQRDKEQDSGS